MELTVQELAKLEQTTYLLIDMRSEQTRAYGMLPGAIPVLPEDLSSFAAEHPDKKLILYCAHGEASIPAAEALCEEGYDAYSLTGGYLAWLREQMARQNDEEIQTRVETSLRKRFREKIWCNFTKAVRQYELVKPGDCIAVCISGGKDSMLMAKLFQELKLHNKFPFEVKFLVMDPGYSPANRQIIEDNLRKLGIPAQIFESDIFGSVYNVEKSPCYLCARMRRGYLYNFARQLGCNKIALGHHYDDVIETILMGMLWGAQVQTMMPKLHSTNFPGMELIRPMYLSGKTTSRPGATRTICISSSAPAASLTPAPPAARTKRQNPSASRPSSSSASSRRRIPRSRRIFSGAWKTSVSIPLSPTKPAAGKFRFWRITTGRANRAKRSKFPLYESGKVCYNASSSFLSF